MKLEELPDRWQKRAEIFLILVVIGVAALMPVTVNWILENGKGIIG